MAVNTFRDLVFCLVGGSALLIYGVDLMGEGLEKASGNLIKKILSILTGRLWSAFLAGTVLTALVQSSTAVTVLTVGFVNANLMGLKQAVGVIYGANIGTTITAQLMAFDLTDISLPVLGIGVLIIYLSGSKTFKYIGQGILGFGMLFLGLKFLTLGVPYLQSDPFIVSFFQKYSNSAVMSILVGTLFTILVQSSSAVVGITMLLAQSNLITISGAIGLMLGSNIGTCATALIASSSGNIAAKRTAWAHTIYNVAGVIIALIIINPFILLVIYVSPGMSVERLIANSHTVFNIMSALIFLPLTDRYVKMLKIIIPDKNSNNNGKNGNK